jgi:hypothetical protein
MKAARVLAWLQRNPTKLTGFLLVILGSVQANSVSLQSVLTPAQYAWFTVVVGGIVAGLGFLNGSRKPQ